MIGAAWLVQERPVRCTIDNLVIVNFSVMTRTSASPGGRGHQIAPIARYDKDDLNSCALTAAEPGNQYNGSRPTTIDLFAGAGGLTEGFSQAGFRCLYANDINAWAMETFRHNHPGSQADCSPIEEVDPVKLRSDLGLDIGDLDVLIGGPPCQGFSINAPDRFLEDPRNSLFKHYIRFLDVFRPKSLLIENVPGMLSLGNGVIFHQIIAELEARGYTTNAKILLAAHYGVPQERWRMIILGSRSGDAPEHPLPTHYATANANFRGGRTLTFKLGPLDRMALLPAVNIKQAITDLPRLELGKGAEEMTYDKGPNSKFSAAMRQNSPRLLNHVAAKLSAQNVARMSSIPPGGNWTDIPRELLPAGMKKARTADHTKRYGRLTYEGLAGTILTKCDPHWSAVFLPDQDRTLTVREAARIQSFPDNYRFLGPRVAQYEQVGNAVPVRMAAAIANALLQALFADRTSGTKANVA